MLKQQKGITLVALVITVIVLLILAGVAMSLITGQDGLFKKANTAATMYKDNSIKENEVFTNMMNDLNSAWKTYGPQS